MVDRNMIAGYMIHTVCALFLVVACCSPLAAVRPDHVRATEAAMQKRLIRKVDPKPPGDVGHIRGDVVFKAVIARDGSVENLQAVSGHPMLIPPAIEAVKQWRYRPILINGYPVTVETIIRVKFSGTDGRTARP